MRNLRLDPAGHDLETVGRRMAGTEKAEHSARRGLSANLGRALWGGIWFCPKRDWEPPGF